MSVARVATQSRDPDTHTRTHTQSTIYNSLIDQLNTKFASCPLPAFYVFEATIHRSTPVEGLAGSGADRWRYKIVQRNADKLELILFGTHLRRKDADTRLPNIIAPFHG